jgi:hypothetical protein
MSPPKPAILAQVRHHTKPGGERIDGENEDCA